LQLYNEPNEISMRVALFFLFTIHVGILNAQEIWTVGPMVQINFGGGEKLRPSFAIEIAYWKVKGFPYSVDFALEFEKGKTRIYSELQTGIGIAGLSAGPVFEFNKKEGKARVGWQATFWANYYLGFNYRIRHIDNKRLKAIGAYLKLPVVTSGIESNSSNSDWGDWD
jgi:hypothetical protein